MDASYAFARNLYEEIVRRFGRNVKSPILMTASSGSAPKKTARHTIWIIAKPHYKDLYSSEFKIYWKYTPMFRIMDLNDFNTTFAVFLMLFVFISVICFAAVFVIAYTRCMAVAYINRQVYDDPETSGR